MIDCADLAVGAPYEGQGAVYIFRGGHSGLQSEPSQRIYAGQLPILIQPLRTFGHSLSAGVDMDLNGYPDMVVGAFGADKLLMLRARPVINVVSTMRSTPSMISPLTSSRCEDRPDTSCIELELCFQFTTKPRDRFVATLKLSLASLSLSHQPLPYLSSHLPHFVYHLFSISSLVFIHKAFSAQSVLITFKLYMTVAVTNNLCYC